VFFGLGRVKKQVHMLLGKGHLSIASILLEGFIYGKSEAPEARIGRGKG
jgi:hypothetical protein